jgi:protein-disulfide isomerase
MRLAKAGLIAVLLSAPQVGAQTLVRPDSPSRGPHYARATVVLFCDFQCQHCASVKRYVDGLPDSYPNEVRVVYRYFPLDRVHPQADEAAEAAACAQDQGKFWPMYDSLYNNQGNLDENGLKRQAREIGLNGPVFDRCLRTGRHTSTWKRDFADGTAAGVSGTPTFFVNGQMIEGVEAVNSVDALVQGALAR